MEYISIHLVRFTVESGRTISMKAEASMSFLMAVSMMDNGRTASYMEKEFILTERVTNGKACL